MYYCQAESIAKDIFGGKNMIGKLEFDLVHHFLEAEGESRGWARKRLVAMLKIYSQLHNSHTFVKNLKEIKFRVTIWGRTSYSS